MKDRAIVRTDEYGSYEIWFIDIVEGHYPLQAQVFAPVPCYKVRRLRNHCHTVGSADYYRRTKMVRRPLAQAVLNLYEKQFDCKGQHRLVMKWVRR